MTNNGEHHNAEYRSLIAEIKRKKELQGVSDAFVRKEISQVLLRVPRSRQVFLEWNPRSSVHKQLVKKVRERLRRVYGLFRVIEGGNKKREFSCTLEGNPSTKERLSFYPELYRQLFALTGKPNVILDLACGVNPLSLPWMKLEKLIYHAYDVSEDEIQCLNAFFTKYQARHRDVRGRAKVSDISDPNVVKSFPPADIAFLFKATDILDRGKGHRKTEEVLKAVPAQYVVLSFSTLTMSGKPMTAPRRRWVEWLCRRLGYSYELLEFPNELFYVIRKVQGRYTESTSSF